MADFGFGSGPFGVGPFGRAHTSKDALWRRAIPFRQKQDDAENNNHLERYLEVVGATLDRVLEAAWDFPNQVDPVLARSGQEFSESLTLTDITRQNDGTVRVTVDPSQVEIVEIMFGASTDPATGNLRQDGWVAVIDNFDIFQISRVRAWDEESDPEGAATLDVVTNLTITSPLEVRPPDLLFRLASNFAPTVDRADPADFSRRALYRHRLLRDLKVSSRMFELLGKIYGFDVDVSGLFCISEDWYLGLLVTDPLHAFELPPGSGKYFTDLPLFGHLYDQIPADVIPTDTRSDVDFPVEIGVATEVSEDRWCFSVSADELYRILSVGFWQVIDVGGVAYYIEEINLSKSIENEDTGVVSDGGRGPYALEAEQAPLVPGSLVISWTDKDLSPQTATDDESGTLIGGGTGTVDYTTGDIELATTEFTDGGTASDWIPSESPVDGLSWLDAYVIEPLDGASPKGGAGSFDSSEFFVGWMSGAAGYLAVTLDGGFSWSLDADFPFTEDDLNGVDGDVETTSGPDTTIWVVGEDRIGTGLPGGVWYWSYDTESWTEVTHSVASGWRDVAAFDGSSAVVSVLAVGYAGVMAYWDGSTMQQTGAGITANDLNAVSMENGEGVAATGSITVVSAANLAENDFFTIDDGLQTFEFEFDLGDGIVGPSRFVIDIIGGESADDVRDLVIDEINNAVQTTEPIHITASNGGPATVSLVHDDPGPGGNNAITEFVTDPGFTVDGMSGGVESHQTFVVGDAGTLLEVTAWGTVGDFATATWADQSSSLGGGVSEDLSDIAFLTPDPSKGVLVGDNSEVWLTTDYGSTWSSVSTGFAKDWVACFWQGGATGDFIVLVASDGTVIASMDQGSAWAETDTPTFGDTMIGGDFKDLDGSAHPYGLAVGSSGTTWYYSEDGRLSVPGSGSSFFLDYDIDEVCVISATQPTAGTGSLRLEAQKLCNKDYRPAAAYRIVAEPDEVLDEPGAVVTNLLDRIEEKIRLYVPIHIRLLDFVVRQVATVDLLGTGFALSGEDFVLDEATADAISGTRFDSTAADVEPLDSGAFYLEGTLTIT